MVDPAASAMLNSKQPMMRPRLWTSTVRCLMTEPCDLIYLKTNVEAVAGVVVEVETATVPSAVSEKVA